MVLLILLISPLFCLPAIFPALLAERQNSCLERGPLAVFCFAASFLTCLCLSFTLLGGGLFMVLLPLAMAILARFKGIVRRYFPLNYPRWLLFWSQLWGNLAFIVLVTHSELLGAHSEAHMAGFVFLAVLALAWLQCAPAWGAPSRPSISPAALEQRALVLGHQALADRALSRRERRQLGQILARHEIQRKLRRSREITH